MLVAWWAAEALQTLPPPKDGTLYLVGDGSVKPKRGTLHDHIIAQELVTHDPIRRVEEWGRSHGMEVTLREDICRLWYGHELMVMKRPIKF